MNEVTIILKNDEKTFKQTFLCYDNITFYNDYQIDPVIEAYIEEAKLNFVGDPDEITIKLSCEIS